jgi:lysophospholipase L1-like esterase
MTGTGGNGPLGTYQIAAWGDSLTAGNEDGSGITYPNQLAALTG